MVLYPSHIIKIAIKWLPFQRVFPMCVSFYIAFFKCVRLYIKYFIHFMRIIVLKLKYLCLYFKTELQRRSIYFEIIMLKGTWAVYFCCFELLLDIFLKDKVRKTHNLIIKEMEDKKIELWQHFDFVFNSFISTAFNIMFFPKIIVSQFSLLFWLRNLLLRFLEQFAFSLLLHCAQCVTNSKKVFIFNSSATSFFS